MMDYKIRKKNPQNLSVSMWGLWRGVKLDEVFSHTNKYTLWTELTDPTARGDEVASFRGIRVREPQKGGGTGDTSFKTHQSLKWCVPMIIYGRMQSFLSFSHTHQHTFSVPFPLSVIHTQSYKAWLNHNVVFVSTRSDHWVHRTTHEIQSTIFLSLQGS